MSWSKRTARRQRTPTARGAGLGDRPGRLKRPRGGLPARAGMGTPVAVGFGGGTAWEMATYPVLYSARLVFFCCLAVALAARISARREMIAGACGRAWAWLVGLDKSLTRAGAVWLVVSPCSSLSLELAQEGA